MKKWHKVATLPEDFLAWLRINGISETENKDKFIDIINYLNAKIKDVT